ncbi:hypothetical protein MTR67_031298 [Solanum verrucosum]|uniref:Uncharacterized protein n=1 Tax=Solanum verrucosum TaxID=315347 RepID=A0AAF0U271_SOLVR|nr:hypothetical protein MTR67_031298 [Solanum verrucosum]
MSCIVPQRSSGHGRPQFRQSFSGQGSSNAMAPKFNKENVSNHNPQGGDGNEYFIPTCQKCLKSHSGKCLAGMDSSCAKNGHKIRDYPLLATKGRDVFPDIPPGRENALWIGLSFVMMQNGKVIAYGSSVDCSGDQQHATVANRPVDSRSTTTTDKKAKEQGKDITGQKGAEKMKKAEEVKDENRQSHWATRRVALGLA